MSKTVYVAMSGLSGYLPNYTAYHDDYESAVDDLQFTNEIGKRKTAELRRNGYVDLSMRYHGAEYAEVYETTRAAVGIDENADLADIWN